LFAERIAPPKSQKNPRPNKRTILQVTEGAYWLLHPSAIIYRDFLDIQVLQTDLLA
jgi:hypothetical protein